MNYMKCTTCTALVNANATGICMACQMQNGGVPQEDTYKEPILAKSVNKPSDLGAKSVEQLMERQKEIEDALQKSESKSMDACEQAEDGKTVGKGNAKRRKTPKKKGKIQEKCKKMT